jgi:hypothetical protein
LAAARAEAYPESGAGGGAECLLLAMETVDACRARESAMSGKARCLPRSRRACPERSRRDAGVTSSRFTHELCGKPPITPITSKVLSAAQWRTRLHQLLRNQLGQDEGRGCGQAADRHGLYRTAPGPGSRVPSFQISEQAERGQGHYRRIREPVHGT